MLQKYLGEKQAQKKTSEGPGKILKFYGTKRVGTLAYLYGSLRCVQKQKTVTNSATAAELASINTMIDAQALGEVLIHSV